MRDHPERRWRYLDTCRFPTLVYAPVPRLKCPTHGIKQLPVPWAEADGIMQRAVRRGLALRILAAPRHAGVDETSFQKRHEDGTVVSDLERGVVVHAADNRGREALDGFWTRLMAGQRAQTEAVAMDFWEPYIQCGGLDLHPAGR